MKTLYSNLKFSSLFSAFAFIALLFSPSAYSQTALTPGQAAKFGIDGDLRSDERQNGSFAAAASHDWFKKDGGSGIGLFDVTDAASLKTQLASGANITFTKKMQFPLYSVQGGVLLIDAIYSRDYMDRDKTAFASNNTKNTASPLDWGTSPGGSNVSDKTDIIDTYVSLRRDGTTITGSNPSNLVATMALSTLATNGDHYADFEFYKQRIGYNQTTGKFENSGSTSTGGHTVWEFNADGSIKSWGDMTVSFSFNNSNVSDIKIMIWVSKTVYNTVNPKNFDFAANEFYESVSTNGYGYAAIRLNGGGQVAAWGTVNSATTAAPAWGSNSKDLGSNSNNYYVADYAPGQFAEAAVDLTNLGIDPATYAGTNPCSPPFARFMAKSRSSSSFSSALSDFTGPYELLDSPTLPSAIANSTHLTCSVTGVRLDASGFVNGGYYNWTTAEGSINNTATDKSYIEVNKPGKYYLTTAVGAGCTQAVDSVIVTEDNSKPVATAGASPQIFVYGQTVTLIGGNPVASNFATPFGNSAGLTWQWDGVNGTSFASALQNPVVGSAGNYRLVVTEKRNGCKDTAFVTLAAGALLPVTFTEFTGVTNKQNGTNRLSWKVASASDVAQFVAEKSSNGVDFKPAGYVFADEAHTAYSLADNANGKTVYYRIQAVQKSGAAVHSSVIKLDGDNTQKGFAAFADNAGIITVRYTAAAPETVSIKVVNMNGQVVRETTRDVAVGVNLFKLSDMPKPTSGVYVVMLAGPSSFGSAKMAW